MAGSLPVLISSTSHEPAETRHTRILALDAGGVKCLSSLLLLEELMKGVSASDAIAKPCDHFDLICGSQWGGVLAIMLGRLKMSIEECRISLSEVSWNGNNLFKRLLPSHGTPSSNYFEQFFKKLVEKKYSGKEDELFYTPEDDFESTCKTAVLAYDINGAALPTVFRPYFSSKEKHRCEIPIWKIALAIISNPNFMIPVQLKLNNDSEPREFIDASIVGYSNPSREALNEGKGISNGRSIKAVINIGTGDRAQTTTPTALSSWLPTVVHLALIRLLYDVSTDPQRVAYELERDGIEGRFYGRLNVESGLHSIHSMDFSMPSRKTVVSQTETYLTRNPDMVGRIRGWSTELTDSSSPREENNGLSFPSHSGSQQSALFDTQTQRPNHGDLATDGWFESFKDVSPLFSDEWEDEEAVKVKVAILDTGIDASHPFFMDAQKQPRYHKYRDFTKELTPGETEPPADICGHGTHIAGVFLKIAPHVELYVARVFEGRSLGTKEARRVAEAIKYATETWKVDIISMSFGFDVEHSAITDAIDAAYEQDIVMLAAVSNYGNRPLCPIAFPARHPYALCINSADGNGNKSSFNPPARNRRGKTRRDDNFSILGQNIRSCWPTHLAVNSGNESNAETGSWEISSGSSVATAVAASIAALVMELGRRNKGLIAKHEKLETFRGIQQVFTLMAGEDEVNGFKNIRPWNVLRGSQADAAHRIDKEVKNP